MSVDDCVAGGTEELDAQERIKGYGNILSIFSACFKALVQI